MRLRRIVYLLFLACLLVSVAYGTAWVLFLEHDYHEALYYKGRIDNAIAREKSYKAVSILVADPVIFLKQPDDEADIARLVDALRHVEVTRLPALKPIRLRAGNIIFHRRLQPPAGGYAIMANPG